MTLLRHRDRQPELMDDPALDPGEHRRALAGLARINRVSGSVGVLWPAVARLARERGGRLRLLDVATGRGDVAIGLCRRAQSAGIDLAVEACDISPLAVREATEAAGRAGSPARFFVADALQGPLPGGFDVVTCSLFLHHLADADAVRLLSAMRQAGSMVLVNDLARGPLNYGLVWLAVHALSRSRVVRTDGPLSVRAAYTVPELRDLASRAGLSGATVAPRFPGRMLLTWRAPS